MRPSRSDRTALIVVLVLIGLLTLLAVGGVVGVIAWARHAEEADAREARQYPTYPAAHSLAGKPAWVTATGEQQAMRFAWRTGDLLVYADRQAGLVAALSARDGAKRWTYQVPAAPRGYRICERSAASAGLIALSFPRGSKTNDCSGLVLLELATGKARWTIHRPNRIYSGLAITRGRLIVADLDLVGLDLRTGAVRWTHRERDLGCGIQNLMATPGTLAATGSCGKTGRHEAWTIDPVTGRALTKVPLEPTPAKPRMAIAELKSVEPLVVAHSLVNLREMDSTGRLTTLAPGNRKVLTSVALRLAEGRVVGGDSSVMAVSGHRAVLAGTDGRLTGRDLRTGRLLWARAMIDADGAADRATNTDLLIAGADEDGVYGIAVDAGATRAGVFRADPETGAIRMISPVLSPSPIGRSGDPWLFWSNGLYGVNAEQGLPVAFALR